jgi:hypothetical protein
MLEPTIARKLSQGFNGTDKPAGHLKVHNAGRRLWENRPDELNTVNIFDGYKRLIPGGRIIQKHHQITKDDWLDAWDKETNKRPLKTGHTYRIYIRYRRPISGICEFRNIAILDADSLTSPGGNVIKIGEVEL